MDKIFKRSAASLALTLALMLALESSAATMGEQAASELRNPQGQVVGTATFIQEETAVRITITLNNLSPGFHGVHIHAVGRCEPPDFASAGPHFNPLNKKHGLESPDGPHAGDLPNLLIAAGWGSILELTTDRVTLTPGPLSLFDNDGSALVIHASLDDQKTDPSGNSGGRIACGVIQPTSPSTVPAPAARQPQQEVPLFLGQLLLAVIGLLLIEIAWGCLR